MQEMSRPEVDGLNTGYAALLLEQYLENPSAVPSEWRALFESALLAVQPGLARLVELLQERGGNGHVEAPVPPPSPVADTDLDHQLAPAIAAAMSLVTAYRTHGHLAARLDPLGSEPASDCSTTSATRRSSRRASACHPS